ncbi:M48 family metalloprotease [Halosolutus gelatinilyticus]|uniref:M48 family metalloprotease n=1 Tax=Halosolutus gelatinilyticus TaxID=2931975 RepID=UPI001FF2FD89|nr:M48 family metalloprotease [Halosolutus gelatinilyticus]
MTFRLRICAVLAVLVAVNALFVFALLWAYGVLMPGLVAGSIVYARSGAIGFDFLQMPVSWPAFLLVVAAFLAAQTYYGYRRVLSGTRGGDDDATHAVARIVRRLAMTADVPEPAVRVVDDETPSCYTVGRLTDATIVVTTGLVDRLDADELEAVLAHELAHVANRDVTLMTIATLFVEIADRSYHAARLARRALTNPGELSTRGSVAIRWFLPLVALTYVFVAPILWAFPAIADWATRTLSHAREFAADAAAARMTGNPLALATALLTLDETTAPPEDDLRAARTRALCVVPAVPVTGDETTSVPDLDRSAGAPRRRERVSSWLAGTPSTVGDSETHPPLQSRVRRLQRLAAELEGVS